MGKKIIRCLPHILDESAARWPANEAFRFDQQSLTYAELLQSSNGLAAALREQGVQTGDRVGIYLKKSLESAVAVYGIWKAGAAYVPLDPMAPTDRLSSILRDCEIQHLVCHSGTKANLCDLLQTSPQLRSVVGTQQPENFAHGDTVEFLTWEDIQVAKTEHSLDVSLTPGDLAYVMYTSGSTGEPKGIMHTHHSGLSYARLAAGTYDLRPEDRLGNHAPLHFDQSTMEYFAGPLAGATTVIIPEIYTKMPASLSQLIEMERMTIWYSVPFALIQLLLRGVLETRNLAALRWILFGGETFPPKFLNELMQKIPTARFSNVYGPAEVNQCTYFHVPPLTPSQTPSDEDIPIGKIWDDSEGIIVDDQDREVIVGDVGELLVRSPTMMQGYWRRPDLNSLAFYEKPNPGGETAVFYRTGDLVIKQSDGNMMFLGRKDRQIKVRGYRVELDEVESVLSSHHEVEEAAAVSLAWKDGQQQVVAVVLPKSASTMTPTLLQTYAATKLPSYAVPVHVWLVDDLPRTATDKIDRIAVKAQVKDKLTAETERPEKRV